MRETFPTRLLLRVLQATPEELAAIEHFLGGQGFPDAKTNAEGRMQNAEYGLGGSSAAGGGPAYVFRRAGRRWEVVFGGGTAFRLRNTLGARYLNYLLHEPNEPIHAFDLEVEIQPQKGEARAVNSIQPESDPKALREYRKDLERLKAERAKAQAAGDRAKVEALNGQIAALESALKPGGAAADTGERARDNVRKALAVVKKQLRGGGPEERAFAEHLRTHLSIGYECLYSHPQGRIWG